jgi:hypothetical protein
MDVWLGRGIGHDVDNWKRYLRITEKRTRLI